MLALTVPAHTGHEIQRRIAAGDRPELGLVYDQAATDKANDLLADRGYGEQLTFLAADGVDGDTLALYLEEVTLSIRSA